MSSFSFDYLPANLEFPDAVTGDTFDGIALQSVLVDDAPPANALAKLEIHFRRTPATTGDAALKLSSTDGGVTISDAAAWTATINSFTITLGAGTWYHDWQFTDAAGNVRTYIGGTWRIVQDVTHL